MSTLFGSGVYGDKNNSSIIASSNSDPKWFQDTKKRTIANHLVPRRKAGLQVATTEVKGTNKNTKNTKNLLGLTSEDKEYNILSFGVNQRKALTTGSSLDIYDTSSGNLLHDTVNDTIVEDFTLYNNNDDLPPSRSIYDLNDDVLISFNKPTNQNTDSFINKNPKSYNNAFSKLDDTTESAKITPKDQEPSNLTNPLDHSESAVLIFGYHESLVNQVIAYFLELGTILEPFEVNKSANNNARFLLNETSQDRKKVYPIFSGESWVKITYDNPSSAIDALQENGNVFNGAIIGVVPYTKDTVEKLQKRTLSPNEDIGGGIELSKSIDHPNAKLDSGNGLMADASDIPYVKRIDIKDGSGFFLKATNNTTSDPTKTEAEKKDSEKLGIVGKTCKFLFGFNEL